jgi:hypothetical protein
MHLAIERVGLVPPAVGDEAQPPHQPALVDAQVRLPRILEAFYGPKDLR